MSGVVVGLILYFAITIGISYLSNRMRPIDSQGDYIVGKGFGSIVSGFATASTLASGYAFIGLVGLGYHMGFLSLYQAILAPFCDFLCWRFIAPRVKRLSTKHKSMTTVDLLASLRGDPTGLIRILSGLIVSVFMFAYLGSNIIAAGKAAIALRIDYMTAIIGSSLLVMLYVVYGGVTAAYWAEAFQGVLMVGMCLLMPIAAVTHLGGVSEFIRKLHSIDPLLVSWSGGKMGWPLFAALWLWGGVAIGFLGQPQGLQKFIAIESEEKIPGAALIAILFNTIRQYFPLILGLCCRILFPAMPDAELATPTFIYEFFPNFMGGLMLAAVFAAIMSTNSSLLLQGTAEISVNVLRKGFFKNVVKSEAFYKNFSRLCTGIFGVVAFILAFMEVDSVFSLNQLAWAGLAASFGPALILAIYWKKTTHQGILIGILGGSIITFLWYNGGKPFFGLHQGPPSFVITGVLIVLVSLLTYRETPAAAEK
ncbi:MAG: sodium/proline symporter [Synergistaceae bacterium]|jgi:sodium/proline symporter|nr:sodium/proline symporter [Synergistaceae bacterium]